MAELEMAEEFARRLLGRCCDDAGWGDKDALSAATFVEADRKAVALRAKRELLDELLKQAEVHSHTGHGSGLACALAIVDMQERYPHE
jgi:hypothetical protein